MTRPTMNTEPAVLIGVAATALVALSEALAGGLTWRAALPVVASALIRRYVSPAAGADRTVTPEG